MTQPPSGPPQGPPPWGYYPTPSPPPSPGHGWQIACGAVIGGVATVALPFVSLGVASSNGIGFFLASFLVVPGTGLGLLFAATTRPWGIGLLIGWAIALVVAAGACVALLSGLQ
ncbi:MAG: hypothetical protein ABW004_02390 [Aeromicrobium sp.]